MELKDGTQSSHLERSYDYLTLLGSILRISTLFLRFVQSSLPNHHVHHQLQKFTSGGYLKFKCAETP
jgi:hypothetical protein